MFNFCSLFSGSSGNCFFVESDNTKILIDCGESAKKIVNSLLSINVRIEDINAIIVTHEHVDHVRGLGTISKKYDIPVFANYETWDAIPSQKDKIMSNNICYFNCNKKFKIKDLEILPFSTPHDAANPCGFNITFNKKKLSIATDIGHITPELLTNLENSTFIMIESNYDPEILKYSSYPYPLKQRIAGPYGHLPNQAAGQTISHLLNKGLKSVMLGHLSKENNFPELAYQTVLDEIDLSNNKMNFELFVANRSFPSQLINII